MLEIFTTSEGWLNLVILTFMEIVLGIDNIIFIAIVAGKLPKEMQGKARAIGLFMALLFRILLLSTISVLTKLTAPVCTLASFELSARDLILLGGGLFLLYKTIKEIIEKFENADGQHSFKVRETFTGIITQIIIIDIVFSFDSILTAIGLSNQIPVMIGAVIISMFIMLLISGPISGFLNKFPTLKMLALVFLIAIAFMLVFEGLHLHFLKKEYIYFAMFFCLAYESLNIFLRLKQSKSDKNAPPTQH